VQINYVINIKVLNALIKCVKNVEDINYNKYDNQIKLPNVVYLFYASIHIF